MLLSRLSSLWQLFDQATSKRKGLLLVCVASSLWGLIWVPMHYVESLGISELWVIVIFQLLPFIVLFPSCRKSLFFNRTDWGVYLVAGGAMGIGFVFYALGLIVASVTKTTVLFYLTPIWSTILGGIYLSEKTSKGRWIASIIGLAGCMLIMQLNILDMRFAINDLLGLLSGISWSIGSVVIRKYPRASVMNITLFQYGAGAFLAALAALVIGMPIPDMVAITSAFPIVFIASIFIFLPSVLIIFRVNQFVSPGLVGIVMLSEVVVAALSSALFLGEYLDFMQWVGFIAIIVTGAYIGFSTNAPESDEAD